MEKTDKVEILDLLGSYGHYECRIGRAMDKAGISISKMRRLTGLNHEIIKKYYEDRIVRIDKDAFSRMSYILMLSGIDPKSLLEYIPPENKKDEMRSNPTNLSRKD